MPVIAVEDAKEHLNLTTDADDALLADKIAAAERHLERFTGKAFLQQTLTAKFEGFGKVLELPRAPVQSITEISYLDADRAEQTLPGADYFASPLGTDRRTFVYPAKGKSFPATAPVAGAVTVTFVAGYGAAADNVPHPLREAVRQLAAHFTKIGKPR